MRDGEETGCLRFLSRIPGCSLLRAVFENPIAVREWRILRRRALDWRIWLGLKWSLDPLVWGAPVVLTYAVAPYGLWLVLGCLRGLKVVPAEPLPLDPFLAVVWVFGFYVVSITQVLGATAVTHEREQQTWEQVWLTSLTGRERAAGYYWGRVGPVLLGSAATLAAWWLLQPHYARLLRPFWPSTVGRGTLSIAAGIMLGLSLLAGLVGLLASALSRQTLTAVICSIFGFSHAIGVLLMMAPLAWMASAWAVNGSTAAWVSGLICLVVVLAILWALWLGLESALTRHPVPARLRRVVDQSVLQTAAEPTERTPIG
jgi:hypothetical protein